MTKMTKAQLEEHVAKLEAELEAEKAKGISAKTRIESALASGVNDMDVLETELGIGRKSLSSNLTRLRKEMLMNGKTIITQQHEGRTRLAVVSLESLGWDKPSEVLSATVDHVDE